jgi:hypothetical protein
MSFLNSAGLFGADIPDSVIDNFDEPLYEDQSRSLSDYYGGDLAEFNRQTSTVIQGTHSLELLGASSGRGWISSVPGTSTDLNRTLQQDETAEFNYRTNGTKRVCGLLYFTQSETSGPECYIAGIDNVTGEIRIQYFDGAGGFTTVASGSVTVPTNETLTGSINPQSDGTHAMELRDSNGSVLQSISGSDSRLASGGNGWINDQGESTSAFVDLADVVA